VARVGQFLGPTEVYGAPLAIAHPADNNVAGSRYHPLLLDPKLNLDEQQMSDMQQQIMELFRVLQLGRDLPTP